MVNGLRKEGVFASGVDAGAKGLEKLGGLGGREVILDANCELGTRVEAVQRLEWGAAEPGVHRGVVGELDWDDVFVPRLVEPGE
eukprot:1464904-Rhodomonas_salina.1